MAIGKAELKATDIMTAKPICVRPATTIRELARVFEIHRVSGAPVVDATGAIVGVVSKSDLIRRCSDGTDEIPPAYLFEILSGQSTSKQGGQVMPEPLICVADLMTEDALTVDPGTSVTEVARRMFQRHVHRAIVVDEKNCPIGIVTSMDVLGKFPTLQ